MKNPLEGYRRLTFMMLEGGIVAVSPTSVWRVLGQAGLLSKWKGEAVEEGHGLRAATGVHQHWHIDMSYINISGTFYYLCSILDGCSRYIVNWDLRESTTEPDIEVILEHANDAVREELRLAEHMSSSCVIRQLADSRKPKASPTLGH